MDRYPSKKLKGGELSLPPPPPPPPFVPVRVPTHVEPVTVRPEIKVVVEPLDTGDLSTEALTGNEVDLDHSDLPDHYLEDLEDWYRSTGQHVDFGGYLPYYGSHTNLCKGRKIQPLFTEPIELIANSCYFRLWKDELVGLGRLLKTKFPKVPEDLLVVERKTLYAEFIVAKVMALPLTDPIRIKYFRNLKVLSFMRGTWDAMLHSFQLVVASSMKASSVAGVPSWYVTTDIARAIDRFRRQIVYRPLWAAKRLKTLGGECRAWFFDSGPRPRDNLVKTLPTKWYANVWSYVQRALPPPPPDKQGVKDLWVRLTSPPVPEPVGWKGFCREYFISWPLTSDPDKRSYSTYPSGGGSFGYSRSKGGFSKAVSDLTVLGYCLRMRSGDFDDRIQRYAGLAGEIYRQGVISARNAGLPTPEYPGLRNPGHSDVCTAAAHGWKELPPGHKCNRSRLDPVNPIPANLRQLIGLAGAQEEHQKSLRVAAEYVINSVDYIPVQPLHAEERGLKVRFPTKTLAAANLLMQPLRRASDMHQIRDPETSKSAGGHRTPNLAGKKGPWYSQDLSLATDCHPFWLTRGYYEELLDNHPKLEWIRKYFDKLFGPRKLVPDKLQDFPDPPEDDLHFASPRWEGGWDGLPDIVMVDFNHMLNHIQNWDDWLVEINLLKGPLTTKGAMMGDATSFPLLPMVTKWAKVRAGIRELDTTGDDAVIPFGRVRPCPVLGMSTELSHDMSLVIPGSVMDLARVEASSLAETRRRGLDDPEVRKIIYEAALEEIGGVLSRGDPKKDKPNKIFWHETKASFCEQTMFRGRFLGHIPTSLLTGPPGGSKGQVDWFNQPSALLEHGRNNGIPIPKRLWRTLPFYIHARCAYKLGIPVREPVAMGGILHPLFPHNCGANGYLTQRWLSTLSQISIGEWATGTGLSPFPPSGHGVARRLSRKWVDELVSQNKYCDVDDQPLRSLATGVFGPLPSVQEGAELASQSPAAFLLYGKEPPEVFLKTPSIRAVSGKFRRRVMAKKNRPGVHTYESTVHDITRKQQLYIANPNWVIQRGPSRNYGVMPSSVEVGRTSWRWQWGGPFVTNRDSHLTLFMDSLARDLMRISHQQPSPGK